MEDFEKLLAAHQATIRLVFYKLHLYKDFEHYEQIASVALWQAAKRYTGPANEFKAYAYTSIRYALLAELKKQRSYEDRHVLIDETSEMESHLHKKQHTIEEGNEELLALVTPAERWLLQAIYVDNQSYEHLANVLQISVDGVKKRRQRAINKLRAAKNIKPREKRR